ncbi:uncharacterized protein LOC120263148 [Dioscorea cayenensis subsp. rotundata]|uniref:Uncharacterized protein LOC120263148 n=1 Tax=Dioscorea cayennensis subsp. rotundata TaxID=55577 RepID=A0AB40BKU0_DIOCR|nr:uncharacterized protein LOC120263148 [Dioscorea cayenensis subsp. rotundata]
MNETDSKCDGSGGLQSCFETNEEGYGPEKHKYLDFHAELDMNDPHFEIGMKFSSFNQFKELVRNYGIKNRYVMNFRPSNKKRCKAICKKGCPFYLWAASMIKDHNTIQIKSGILKHECTRDHNVRHVSAKWVVENYLDQFRVDPGWSIESIMQAVMKKQQVNITRLKAWKAKSIAKNLLDGDECEQIKSLYDYMLETRGQIQSPLVCGLEWDPALCSTSGNILIKGGTVANAHHKEVADVYI